MQVKAANQKRIDCKIGLKGIFTLVFSKNVPNHYPQPFTLVNLSFEKLRIVILAHFFENGTKLKISSEID